MSRIHVELKSFQQAYENLSHSPGDGGFNEMEPKEGDRLESVWNELANGDKLSQARQLREIVKL
jgi:hypothetical protein